MGFLRPSHDVQVHPIPVRYRTDTATHKRGDEVRGKYLYYVVCIHPRCVETRALLDAYRFTSMAKAEEFAKQHVEKNTTTFTQTIKKWLEQTWDFMK